MPNTILIGAQWGDEGKGKIIDFLTDEADIVVRSQGGNNAGHTVILGSEHHVLHLVPSGILHPEKTCVIGNGVVIDPPDLVSEIEGLRKRGVRISGNLLISDRAHIVFPYHRELDECHEGARGVRQIGTTRRGIGPCYGDKVQRSGLRMGDFARPKVFSEKLREKVAENNTVLKAYGRRPIDFETVNEAYLAAGKKLKPFIKNTVVYLHEAINARKNILLEGAQGTFLDIDHGTYPYVTSSNTTAGGACTGTGVPPHRIDCVIGVMKAYASRVGEGPFPTENEDLSSLLHNMGREFGATGRPRRCGWFDAVATRYAGMLNGFDEVAITNLDGLDRLETIKVCVAYKIGGKTFEVPPSDLSEFEQCKPVYIELPGWKKSTAEARSFSALPAKARAYLKTLADLSGARFSIASVGPAREQTIRL